MSYRLEDDIFLCVIFRASLDEFCSHKPEIIKNNLTMLKRLNEVGDGVLGLVEEDSKFGTI